MTIPKTIEVLDVKQNQIMCPFRTAVTTYQTTDGIMHQDTNWPECLYGLCPFYVDKKCTRCCQ